MMISPKKIVSFSQKKFYPTLNIFDPVTLKTWANMRKVMLEFGNKFVMRNGFNITVVLTIYSVVFAVLIIQALGIVKNSIDTLTLIIFAYETIVYFTIFIILL